MPIFAVRQIIYEIYFFMQHVLADRIQEIEDDDCCNDHDRYPES